MPHPHSLFLLADHHHHHDGTIEDDGHEHGYGEPASHQAEIAKRGPVVQAATPDGVAGEQISLALEEFGSAASSGVSEPFVWPLHLPLAGIGEPPEPPPPRAATVIT